MRNIGVKIKKLLFAIILLALFLPVLQMKFSLFKAKALAGVYVKKEKAGFSAAGWFQEEYQKKTEAWFNEQTGSRLGLVRLRNQIYWEVFGKSRNDRIVVGKDNYLYDWDYINAWSGADFKGDEHFRKICGQLRALQDTLAKRDVVLLVALAPGKASYASEHIPDGPWKREGEKTNYKSLSSQLKTNGVNTIDLYHWFLQMKPTAAFPLYSKGGVHWSNYGCWLAMDSVVKYLEKRTGKDLVSMQIKSVNFSEKVRQPDNDVGELLNLLTPPQPTKMAYPEIQWENHDGKTRPDIYVVSDSYFWQMFGNGFSKEVFNEIRFDYYNRTIYRSKKEKYWEGERTVDNPFDPGRDKVLLLMSTDANLRDFPWGFLKSTTWLLPGKK
jgi:SGNH hydrolase-like domain, acetyltransferase AlgX